VAPPGFCNEGGVRYGSIWGLEYEVPQSRLYCLCIIVALCSRALQCICRVIRRSSMTMKAHKYYIIFGRPPIGRKLLPLPLAAPLNRTIFSKFGPWLDCGGSESMWGRVRRQRTCWAGKEACGLLLRKEVRQPRQRRPGAVRR